MGDDSEVFVGIDTSKLRHAVAIAAGGRGGEVRFLGEIEASEAAVTKLVRQLAAKYGKLFFCYEAGPTGYGLYRLMKRFAISLDSVRAPGSASADDGSSEEPG